MGRPRTKEEFFSDWCVTARITEQKAKDIGLVVETCDCGMCDGFRMGVSVPSDWEKVVIALSKHLREVDSVGETQ